MRCKIIKVLYSCTGTYTLLSIITTPIGYYELPRLLQLATLLEKIQ